MMLKASLMVAILVGVLVALFYFESKPLAVGSDKPTVDCRVGHDMDC